MTRISLLARVGLRDLPGEQVLDRTLSRAERVVYDQLPSEPRQQEWLAGRLAAKLTLRRALAHPAAGWPLREVEVLPDANGAPVARLFGVQGPAISISHTGRYAVAAVAPLGYVGVDIEEVQPRPPAVLRHIATDAEQYVIPLLAGGGDAGATALWALKEATLKALGCGLQEPPSSVVVSMEGRLDVNITGPLGADARVLHSWLYHLEDHVIACVVLARVPATAARSLNG